MSSKSVALKQYPSKENVQSFISDILKAQESKQILIMNPYVSDLIDLVENSDFTIFSIFLNANKSTIEKRLISKGVLEPELTEDIHDAIKQISLFENSRNLFQFTPSVDTSTKEDIARQIVTELIINKIVTLKK